MQPFDSLDVLERASFLDPLVNRARTLVQNIIQPQLLRDVLHGTWLGHPLHPVLTDIPIGAWTSAVMLDFFPKTGAASSALIATGLVSVAPTVASGWTDWSELHQPEQRTGLVHAVANVAGTVVFAASLAARVRGRYARGKALGLTGLALVTVGGTIGGHLSFRRGAGANRTADVMDTGPTDWTTVASLDDLPEGQPVLREVADWPVLLYREGRTVRALIDRCSHLSGPLHEGKIRGSGSDACVVCPWHGSTFRLRNGAVVHGPATAPQPVLETRVLSDHVEVRIPG